MTTTTPQPPSADAVVHHMRALRVSIFALLGAIGHPAAEAAKDGDGAEPRDSLARLVHQTAACRPAATRDATAASVAGAIYGGAVALLVDDLDAAHEDLSQLLETGPGVSDDALVNQAEEIPAAMTDLRRAVTDLVQGVGVRLVLPGDGTEAKAYADTGEPCGLDDATGRVNRLLVGADMRHTAAERAIAACKSFFTSTGLCDAIHRVVTTFRAGRRELLGITDADEEDEEEDDEEDDGEEDDDEESSAESGSDADGGSPSLKRRRA